MEKSSNKLLRILVIIIALPIALYISIFVWIQKRTIFEKLTYKPVSEQEALEHSTYLRTVLPTELQVVSDNDNSKLNVPAGTNLKVLGAYMRLLSYRSDYYCESSPRFSSPRPVFLCRASQRHPRSGPVAGKAYRKENR